MPKKRASQAAAGAACRRPGHPMAGRLKAGTGRSLACRGARIPRGPHSPSQLRVPPSGARRTPAARRLTSAASAPGPDPPAGSARPSTASGGHFRRKPLGRACCPWGRGRSGLPVSPGPARRTLPGSPWSLAPSTPQMLWLCLLRSIRASLWSSSAGRRAQAPQAARSHLFSLIENVKYWPNSNPVLGNHGTTKMKLSWAFSSGSSSQLGSGTVRGIKF